jgi:catechol 2,3-dioxygenase-like lactoylglutathione lyase family enzyme
MSIRLDHILVPSRNRTAAAKRLAEILGVPWAECGVGPFSPVYVSDDLTIDFDQAVEPFPVMHYCFHVDEASFESILERIIAAGIPYRSTPHGPVDSRVNTANGGRLVYWNEPDGHVWEILTVSYDREHEKHRAEGAG